MDAYTVTALRLVKWPRCVGVLIIVSCSVALSAIATYLGTDPTDMSARNWRNAWIMTITVPIMVSGPVGYVIISLVHSLEKARHEALHLANTDILTGVFNRRHFVEVATHELDSARESSSTVTVLLLDVDDFKKVNDTHGHDAGDAVLQMVAKQCCQALRPGDSFARWGGEEFVAVLPGTDDNDSIGIALKLRDAISSGEVGTDSTSIKVTASIGVAGKQENDETLSAMITRADHAMYQAKRSGKNSAVLYPRTHQDLDKCG